jgi:multidrug resistance efflux pump
VALREAELKLEEAELRRTAELARSDTATQAELDRRTAQREVSKSALAGAKVAIEDAKAATDAAEAQVAQIEATIADMTLKRRDVAEYSAGHHREFDAAVRAAVNSRLCHHVLVVRQLHAF